MLKPYRNPFASLASLALVAMVVLLASPSHLFGYTDPGTGAFLYQAVYAACIGGVAEPHRVLTRGRAAAS